MFNTYTRRIFFQIGSHNSRSYKSSAPRIGQPGSNHDKSLSLFIVI